MSEYWGALIGSLGFTALIVSPFIINKIIKFKLEIARINSETTIRTEEIRARNQLEMEKLMEFEEKRQNQVKPVSRVGNLHEELAEEPGRSRVNL